MDPPPPSPASKAKSFRYDQQPTTVFSSPVLEQNPLFRSFSSHNRTSSFELDISFSSYVKPNKDPAAAADAEISIFDAQKYFCENPPKKPPPSPSRDQAPPRLSSVSSEGYGRNPRTRSFHATPTASSEASWNSQTGLLVNPPDSVGVSIKNFPPRDRDSKSKKTVKNGIFGRKNSSCCCAGTSSVRVKDATKNRGSGLPGASSASTPQRGSGAGDRHTAQIHPQKKNPSPEKNKFPAPADPPRQQRISASGRTFVDGAGGFSFPVLKPGPNKASEKPGPKRTVSAEDPPRESLEVFQPNNPAIGRVVHFNPGSPLARVETTDDDLGSDASSDLFELESFSTQTTMYPMYRRRDSLDEALTFNARRYGSANGINPNNSVGQYSRRSLDEPPTPSVAATEGYAPSEVSIDWSVTTAEGFDRGSVSNFSVSASEIGGATLFRQRHLQEEGSVGKRKGNGGGLLMMSCRHGKAVSVGPQPMKSTSGEWGGGTSPYTVHVGGRPPRAGKTTGMANDHSGRMSLAFAA